MAKPIWEELSALPHHLRTLALVGLYLHDFAFMGIAIDRAITGLIGLDERRMFLLSPNIPFSSKVQILKTLVFSANIDENSKSSYLKTLNLALGASNYRNNIAHHAFAESEESNGVRFLVVKAQGEIKFPEMDWSVSKFKIECEKLRSCEERVSEMKQTIIITEKDNAERLAYAIKALSWPTPESHEQEQPTHGLSGLLQSGEDQIPAKTSATSETDAQIPPSHQK